MRSMIALLCPRCSWRCTDVEEFRRRFSSCFLILVVLCGAVSCGCAGLVRRRCAVRCAGAVWGAVPPGRLSVGRWFSWAWRHETDPGCRAVQRHLELGAACARSEIPVQMVHTPLVADQAMGWELAHEHFAPSARW
jgi:hypothetical protein